MILIIGGGVIGLCVAWYARQKGYDVSVIERGGADHDGCSLGNAGMIVPSHFIPLAAPGMVAYGLRQMSNPRSPFYVRPRLDKDLIAWGLNFARAANTAQVERAAPLLRDLSLRSRTAYEELNETFGDVFGLTQRGLLMLCKTEHGLEEEKKTAQMAERLGVPAEVLTPDETAAKDPAIQMDVAGSVYFPLDCHLSPSRFVAALTKALEASGVTIHWSTNVTGWRKSATGIDAVLTDRGDFSADEYIIAGGSWSPVIARDLGLKIPLQAGKGYGVTLPTPPQMPALCSILTEARVAVTPMPEGLRLGGTMEIAGLDATINPTRVQGILDAVPKYFPAFTAPDLSGRTAWSGLRPCSPDGLPYIGRTGRYQNLSIATGHAMMGLSLAPITGKLMASVLSGEKPEIDLTLLRPERYG